MITIDKSKIQKAKDELAKRKLYNAKMQYGFQKGIDFALEQINENDLHEPRNIHFVMIIAFFFNRLIFQLSKKRKYMAKVKGAGVSFWLGESLTNTNNKRFTYLGNDTFIVHK